MKKVKRLGIVVMYDPDGTIFDYFEYYLLQLKMVCDYLVLTVNGYLTPDSKEKVEDVVDDIYIRTNEGMDVGAYVDTIKNYLTLGECLMYDEVVLSNDTLFGPFIEFKDIFDEMQKQQCDVWGLNINSKFFVKHIQSYFYCFRNGVIEIALKYWSDVKAPEEYTKSFIVGAYEVGLSNFLVRNGKVIGAYSFQNGFDVFNDPQLMLTYCRYPFLKKSFSSSILEREKKIKNYLECIGYINKEYDYPIEYILDYLKERNHIDIELYKSSLGLESSGTSGEMLETFVSAHGKVYLYGKGEYGQMIYGILGENRIEGFIESDNMNKDLFFGKKVYALENIEISAPIVVAMNRKNTNEVMEKLLNYKNVFKLW